MSEIEKWTQTLKKASETFAKGRGGPIAVELMEISEFLQTLQPSDNAELVEEMVKVKNAICVHSEHPYMLAMDKAIEEISKPRPFDVLEHLRDGGKARSEHANLYVWMDEGEVLHDTYKHGISQEKSLYALLHRTDWQPYTEPEPTPQEILEKARDSLSKGINGMSISKALDAFEKLLKEKDGEI